MNAPLHLKLKDDLAMPSVYDGDQTSKVKIIFKWLNWLIVAIACLFMLYWLFASDRYVSNATIIIQNTDPIGTSSMDFGAVIGTTIPYTLPDQIMLKEHLVSVDMLKKLDAALNLRAHYSDTSHDIASRMWFEDASMEWFHRHFLSKTEILFDEFAGVLRISTQAYSPKMAHAITSMLVKEGESYMNELGHALAREKVHFLDEQVKHAQQEVHNATNALLTFQNKKGMVSPKVTVDGLNAIIARLEDQRTNIQTQIAALPANLAKNHPTRTSLAQSLKAVERQISREKNKLASVSGKPLNTSMIEESLLTLDLQFKQDLYKTALMGLEKGRVDATRNLKQVSVLQMPTMPEYAWEPRRIYGIIATICITLLVLGITALLRSVVLDHVD